MVHERLFSRCCCCFFIYILLQKSGQALSVHPSPPFCWGGGGEGLSFQPIFQKGAGALTGSQFLEGFAGKEGGDFLQGRLQFLHKK